MHVERLKLWVIFISLLFCVVFKYRGRSCQGMERLMLAGNVKCVVVFWRVRIGE